jgi:hypothetical protein
VEGVGCVCSPFSTSVSPSIGTDISFSKSEDLFSIESEEFDPFCSDTDLAMLTVGLTKVVVSLVFPCSLKFADPALDIFIYDLKERDNFDLKRSRQFDYQDTC